MHETRKSTIFPGGQRLEIAQGDITSESVDAIVNAANSRLQHGGGVAGIISRSGGPDIQKESDAWVREHGPVSHECPAWTSAGRLPCRYVIHAVGPIWGSGDEEIKLAAAIHGSLMLADEMGLTSLALPAISTGIFGFPKNLAAGIFFETIASFYHQFPHSSLKLVRLILWDEASLGSFVEAFEAWEAQG